MGKLSAAIVRRNEINYIAQRFRQMTARAASVARISAALARDDVRCVHLLNTRQ
jgi:hypothetical protein